MSKVPLPFPLHQQSNDELPRKMNENESKPPAVPSVVARRSIYPLVSTVRATSPMDTSSDEDKEPVTNFQPETAMVAYRTPLTETAMIPMDTDVGIIKRGTPEKKTVRRSIRNATKAKLKLNNKKSPKSPTAFRLMDL